MKFGKLKSIAHNVADSLASGIGLLIGHYEMDIFGEAAESAEGYILVDFLAGTTSGGRTSEYLAQAILLYRSALPDLCKRQGVDVGAFRVLAARYSSDPLGKKFLVTIEDSNGRRSNDEYFGVPGKRATELDQLGRLRPKRVRTPPSNAD